MKIRRLFLVFIALCCLPVVFADETIYNGTVGSGSTIVLDNTVFSIDIGYNLDEVRVAAGDSFNSINDGDCEDYFDFTWCVLGIFQTDGITYSNLSIVRPQSDINLSFATQTWSGVVSDEIEIDLQIGNDGSTSEEVVVEALFPGFLDVSSDIGCTIIDNELSWPVLVAPNQSKSCTLVLSASNVGNASVVLRTQSTTGVIESDDFSASIALPITVDIDYNKTIDVTNGTNQTAIVLDIENQIDKEVRVHYYISKPQEAYFREPSRLSDAGDYLYSYLFLEENATVDRTFVLRYDQKFNETLSNYIIYTIDDRNYTLALSDLSINFSSVISRDLPTLAEVGINNVLDLFINSSSEDGLGILGTTNVSFSINNTVGDANVSDLRAFFYINNQLADYVFVSLLQPVDKARGIPIALYAEDYDADVLLTLNGSAIINNTVVNFSQTLSVNRRGIEGIDIETGLPSSVTPGVTYSRNVSLTSSLPYPVYVRVVDEYDENLLIQGLTESYVLLNSSLPNALFYEFTVPLDYNASSIEFVSTLYVQDQFTVQNITERNEVDVEVPDVLPTIDVSEPNYISDSLFALDYTVSFNTSRGDVLENVRIDWLASSELHFSETISDVGRLFDGTSVSGRIFTRYVGNSDGNVSAQLFYEYMGEQYTLNFPITIDTTKNFREFVIEANATYDDFNELYDVTLEFTRLGDINLTLPYVDAFSVSTQEDVVGEGQSYNFSILNPLYNFGPVEYRYSDVTLYFAVPIEYPEVQTNSSTEDFSVFEPPVQEAPRIPDPVILPSEEYRVVGTTPSEGFSVWWYILAGLVVLVGIGVYILLRRRK